MTLHFTLKNLAFEKDASKYSFHNIGIQTCL